MAQLRGSNVVEQAHGVIHHQNYSNYQYYHHFTTPHGRDAKLHYYLQLAHKGYEVGKIRYHAKRLYRHGRHNQKPRGVHDYQNLQWDPSIYRGKAFKDFREKNLPPHSTTVSANAYCRDLPYKRKTGILHSNTTFTTRRMKVGGIVRPTTEDIIDNVIGQKNRHDINSKSEMDAFIIEQVVPPEYREFQSQTDEVRASTSPLATQPSPCMIIAGGRRKSTQANIPYIGSAKKDDPIQPLVLDAGRKILEQSLLETNEEYQIAQIHFEMGKYIDKRRARMVRNARFIEHEHTKAEYRMKEKIRTDKEEGMNNESNRRMGAVAFACQLGCRIMHRTFEDLKSQGTFVTMDRNIEKTFRPWLNWEMFRLVNVPRMVLDDVIHKANAARLGEFGDDAYPDKKMTQDKSLQEAEPFEEAEFEDPRSWLSESGDDSYYLNSPPRSEL